MAARAFEKLPKRRFLVRMLAPGSVVLIVGMLCVTIFANDPWVTGANSSANADRSPSAQVAAPVTAVAHYKKMVAELLSIPDACWSGNTVNDLQRGQCDRFWEQTLKLTIVGIFPLLLFGIFMTLAMSSLERIYDRVRHTLNSGRALVKGTVTRPAELPVDTFGWAFCFRSISVNVAGKLQIRVYIPMDQPMPVSGQVLAIFESSEFGAKRYFGVVYLPHVAVYSA